MNRILSVRIGDKLMVFDEPAVMGIINITPDSFAVKCTSCGEAEILSAATTMISQGAKILDIGGYSTRPGADVVSEQEEWHRVDTALKAIRNTWKDIPLSLDTWRSDIARKAVEKYGEMIINDVSAGQWDTNMFNTIAEMHVPYVLTHNRWINERQQIPQDALGKDPEEMIREIVDFFQRNIYCLNNLGVADIILDPGFGFGKTIEENYILLKHLDILNIFNCPVLAGLSRKSMLFKLLDTAPMQALNATTAANMAALERGADILRVHDVKEAVETVEIYKMIR